MATTTAAGTTVGVFSDAKRAREAVAALKKAGYRDDQIGVVSQHSDGTTTPAKGDKVEEGAVAGAATGAGLGALWGLGILAGIIPGIGPAIAGGTLGVLLSSAAAGAAAAGIGGALAGMGISDEDATYYDSEYRSGRTIVTVQGGAHGEAGRLLTQYGGYDRATVPR